MNRVWITLCQPLSVNPGKNPKRGTITERVLRKKWLLLAYAIWKKHHNLALLTDKSLYEIVDYLEMKLWRTIIFSTKLFVFLQAVLPWRITSIIIHNIYELNIFCPRVFVGPTILSIIRYATSYV